MSSSANNNNTPRPAVPRARRSTLRSLKRAVSHSALANLFHSEPAPPTPLIPGAFAAQQPNSVASPKKSLLPLAEPLHHTQQALTPPESPRPQPQPQSQPKVESVLELPRSALTSRKPYALPEPFLPRSMAGHDRQTRALPAGFSVVAKTKVPTAPDAADLQTPDKWVHRNPELVRHTGKHPVNAEVRLNKLFDSGFLTPSEHFYVRSHGAVPQCEGPAADWQIKIHGLVENEISLSIADLASMFEVVTQPVTVVCAGNRRKEQMLVQKGIGFNWGPAGVSTALFTGVWLADILDYVKPLGKNKGKHVIFEGADALPNGHYGTSQYLSWARDRSKGMMIAWLMNGLPLEPDHGFPVRAVVPGHVGGRFVKWLHRIEISDKESNHHLHHFDNKYLPTQLTAEQARAENHWWYEEKYIINELNVNSVIARPNHDETLTFHSSRMTPPDSLLYALEGYAYSGGGRRITRVEISLDHGDTWRLAEVNYPEDKFREIVHEDPVYGTLDLSESEKSYAWCFWKFMVPVRELANSSVICVRAMDTALALQPRDMYWNASCMMNNWWFRVAIHKETQDDKITLRFEHPTLAGPTPGGWIERMKNAGLDPLKPIFGDAEQAVAQVATVAPTIASAPTEISMKNPKITRMITMEEVTAQDKSKPWFIIDGEVYDGTGYLEEHPGGADSILLVAGEDASEDFHAIHSNDGRSKMAQFHIGTLVTEATASSSTANVIAPSAPIVAPSSAVVKHAEPVADVFLNKTKWTNSKLIRITRVSHDSSVFRFALQSPDQALGLPCGQHVYVRLRRKDTGELVQRAYTPLSEPDVKGHIDILIKVYLPSTAFPTGGKMTVGFNDLVVGDNVDMKGPLGSFIWQGRGIALWKNVPVKVKNIGLVSGGSGITPIMQILRAVLSDAKDTETHLWLLDTNKTEQDILCRDDLNQLSRYHPDRFKLHHTLSTSPHGWTFSTGRITDAMLAAHLPPPGPDSLVLICGPEPMIKQTVEPGLQRLGWDTARTLVIF